MKKWSCILFVAFFFINSGYAQKAAPANDDPVLFIVGNTEVPKSEFVRMYKKNFVHTNVSYSRKDVEEYLSLYINFKMKVLSAMDKGIAQKPDIEEELNGYRVQLSQTYMTDEKTTQRLLTEAYDFSKYDLRYSHIMIKLPMYSSPADTLAAYKKIMQIYNRLKNGENFEALAKEMSDDPQSKSQGGDLGYRPPFTVPYPLEKAAYTMSLNQFSKPIRSDVAYHIIKITDKEKALGKIKAAHIFIAYPTNPTDSMVMATKVKIDNIYNQIKLAQKSFEEAAAEYSDDKASAPRGGSLIEFNVTRMVPEFVHELYGLKKNDITIPFQTRFGWHIVKMQNYTGLDTYDNVKGDLMMKLQRDADRKEIIKDAFLDTLKREYKFSQPKNNLKEFIALVDTSLLSGNWIYTKNKAFDKVLFTLNGENVLFSAFAEYISTAQSKYPTSSVNAMIEQMYKNFVYDYCYAYEDSRLETKYPEFKEIMQEYTDGVLLFEITNAEVWNRASTDTAGLTEYYNAQKFCHVWPERIKAVVFKYDPNYVKTSAVKKMMDKLSKKKITLDELKKEAQDLLPQDNYQIYAQTFEPGQDKYADIVEWKLGLSKDITMAKNEHGFVLINEVLSSECKSLDEIKGIIVSEYQTYLEEQWLQNLKAKYPVSVDIKVLNTIVK